MVSGEEYNSSYRFAVFDPSEIIFSLIKPNFERAPLVGCAQLFNRHTHSHFPYPKPVSLRNPNTCHAVITGEAPKMNGVTSDVLHIRVYFGSEVNSNNRPNCFTVNRIAVSSDRRAGTNGVSTVRQSDSLQTAIVPVLKFSTTSRRHMEEWRYRTSHNLPSHYRQHGGQFHFLATSAPGHERLEALVVARRCPYCATRGHCTDLNIPCVRNFHTFVWILHILTV
jgi:hypothetical protein